MYWSNCIYEGTYMTKHTHHTDLSPDVAGEVSVSEMRGGE